MISQAMTNETDRMGAVALTNCKTCASTPIFSHRTDFRSPLRVFTPVINISLFCCYADLIHGNLAARSCRLFVWLDNNNSELV